ARPVRWQYIRDGSADDKAPRNRSTAHVQLSAFAGFDLPGRSFQLLWRRGALRRLDCSEAYCPRAPRPPRERKPAASVDTRTVLLPRRLWPDFSRSTRMRNSRWARSNAGSFPELPVL